MCSSADGNRRFAFLRLRRNPCRVNQRPKWGHEDQFAPSGLNVSCRFGQATFAETHGYGRDAPIAVNRASPMRCPAWRRRCASGR